MHFPSLMLIEIIQKLFHDILCFILVLQTCKCIHLHMNFLCVPINGYTVELCTHIEVEMTCYMSRGSNSSKISQQKNGIPG